MLIGRDAHADAKCTTGCLNSLADFRFTVLCMSRSSPVFYVFSKYDPVRHLLMESAHPGGGKTTGIGLPLLSTDKEGRLNSESGVLLDEYFLVY